MQRFLGLALLAFALASGVRAQEIELPPDIQDAGSLNKAAPDLAVVVIKNYREPDRNRYLNNLFRLQSVAGQYSEATDTIRALLELRRATDPATAFPLLPFELFVKAKAKTGVSFDEAYSAEFRGLFEPLDDRAVQDVLHRGLGNVSTTWFWSDQTRNHNDLLTAVRRQKGKTRISLNDAIDLVRKYFAFDAFQLITPLANKLIAEDDARRYLIDKNVLITTPDGAHLAAIVIRPKSPKQLPSLLAFTIYTDDDLYYAEARRSAAHGYAGVVAYTRGKGRSPETPVPFECDGQDANAVVDWIVKQSNTWQKA